MLTPPSKQSARSYRAAISPEWTDSCQPREQLPANSLKGLAGNDHIDGGEGNDSIEGGIGDDNIDGGLGVDTAVFNGSYGAYQIVVNTNGSLSVTDTVGDDGTDTLIGVEFLQFADQTTVAASGSVSPPPPPSAPSSEAPTPTIVGTAAGRETVKGSTGADVLASGGGLWDKLEGGAGDDAYVVTISQTSIVEAYGGGDDTVYSYASYLAVASEVEHFVLLEGAGGLSANRYDNTILGNAGDNTLNGQAGDDRIEGGGGDDSIDGGLGIDTMVFSGAYANYQIAENVDGSLTVTDTVGSDGTDTALNVEVFGFSDQTINVDDIM